MSAPSEDAEVIFNRANVALARSQKLIESWIGPVATKQSGSSSLWDEAEDEDDFKAVPDNLGVGATVPDEDVGFGLKRRQPTSNDKLLEQILGKKAAREHQAKVAAHKASKSQSAAPGTPSEKLVDPTPEADDSEGEEGRASAFTSRKPRKRAREGATAAAARDPQRTDDEDEDEPKGKSGKVSRQSKAAPAKTNSYLDELLLKKSKKNRKKAE